MHFKNRSAKLFFILTSGLSALTFIIQLLSLVLFYDANIGYYQRGAILPLISGILFALSVVGLIVSAFVLADRSESVSPISEPLRYTALIPAAAILITTLISSLGSSNGFQSLDLLLVIGAIAATGFFASLALAKQTSAVTVVCGIGFILWLALVWLRSYTDFSVTMNSPDKLYFHFACVGAALLAIAELRAAYGIADTRSSYCYISVSAIALTAGALVPVVANLLGVYEYNPTILESAALAALLAYALIRLASICSANPSKAPAEANSESGTEESTEQPEEITEQAEETTEYPEENTANTDSEEQI